MNKSQIAVGATIIALGLVVGLQAGKMSRSDAAAAPEAPPDSTATIELTTQEGDLVRVQPSTLPPPGPKDFTEIAQRITAGRAPMTYLDEILASRGDHIARWVDRRHNPITVWVQRKPDVTDFLPDYPNLARDAFSIWSNAGIPVRFLFVDDSASAEVRLRWVERFPDTAAGKTFWARDLNWWIVGGDIEVALHSAVGETYDRDAVHAIALHEVGHLIGLDHSSSPGSIMAPRVHTLRLSPEDLRTAKLLYQLPPGLVRDTTR